MAVSDSSKVDLLYKKLFGVTKTDTSTNKGAGNESIASPALIRGDKVWTDAASIPATAADVTNVVQSYLTTSRIECTADTTTTPVSSVYPTWKTNLTNWISPEFGSTYFVKVYAETAGNANPTNGIALSDSGSGGTGEWYFDYQSGVLNFIGGTIPAALTASKVIYITGYRYIGAVGITSQTNASTATTANVALTANIANTVLTLSNFTTANLTEGSNQYFTNARVFANVAQMSINVFADVDITGITTNGILSWNGTSFVAGTVGGAATSNVALIAYQADHANTSDNSNVANSVLTISNFSTANLREGSNLYYTDTRVYSNVIGFLPSLAGAGIQIQANGQINATASQTSGFASNANIANLVLTISNFTTSNLIEGSNLYYTNTRVNSYIQPWLTTANVTETASNLYFTTARVFANVAQMSINVFADVDITGITSNGILQWNGAAFVAGTVSASNTSGSSNVANTVLSLSNFTTANLAEGSNLYYTNTRVVSAITPYLTTSNVAEGANLYFTNTRVITAVTPYLTTSNVAEGSNLYYTNARVYANITAALAGNLVIGNLVTGTSVSNSYVTAGNVNAGNLIATTLVLGSAVGGSITGANLISANNIQGTTWIGLYTANVIETNSNLYYTNARVRSTLSGGTGVVYDTANGIISIGQNVATTANVQFSNVKVTNVISTSGDIFVSGNLIPSENAVFNFGSPTKVWKDFYLSATSLFVGNTKVTSNADTGGLSVATSTGQPTDFTAANLFAGNAIITGSVYANLVGQVSTISNFTTQNLTENNSNLYYTNARVYSAIVGNLATKANVTDLTTANVSELTNLYYTNSRVISVVTPYLTTANVIESQSNLYYTNARVFANVAQMSINVFADVDMTGLQTSGILIWNGVAFVAGTVNAAASSNTALIAYQADHANTADVSNVANSVLSLTRLTTSNLLEGTNLYFTNTRAAIGLTGLNVSVNDLYAAGNLTVQGDFTTLNVATLNIEDKNITLGKGLTTFAQADGAGISVDGAQANITYLVSGDKFSINKNVEIIGDIKANTWTGLYSANVVESTNQYFTNARAVLAITPYLTTANVTEVNNQYFTNARVVANLELQSINVFSDVDISGINNDELLLWNSSTRVFRPSSFTGKLTTANVVELTNLYFTNARVFTALSDGTANLSIYNLTTNGLLTVSSGSGAETTTGIEFKNNPAGGTGDTAKIQYYAANIGVNDDTILELSVANNPGDSINFKTTGGGVGVNVARPIAEFDVAGNINARNSLIFSSVVVGPTAQFNAVTANTWNNLYTSNVIEGNNLYYTNARVLSIVTPLLTTSNVAEGSNLYYTNARVYANVIGIISSKANTTDLTTANVLELTNQYFTNVRAILAITPYLTTSNVAEGSNLYYTNARVYAAIQGNLATKANTTDLTTANVTELNNQYFTNARVFANVAQMSVNVFADVDITGVSTGYSLIWNGTQFIATAQTSVANSANTALFAANANVANTVLTISNFTTSNLVEGSNLYYTDARFDNRLATKSTTNLGEGTNLYYTNARVLSALTGNVTIGNLKVSTAVNYSNTTGVTKVYQYYNESSQSLDTIFL